MPLPEQLIDEAMGLSEEQRAELATLLMDSIGAPDSMSEKSDSEFIAELRRRADAVESGQSSSVPWEQVRARLLAKLR